MPGEGASAQPVARSCSRSQSRPHKGLSTTTQWKNWELQRATCRGASGSRNPTYTKELALAWLQPPRGKDTLFSTRRCHRSYELSGLVCSEGPPFSNSHKAGMRVNISPGSAHDPGIQAAGQGVWCTGTECGGEGGREPHAWMLQSEGSTPKADRLWDPWT